MILEKGKHKLGIFLVKKSNLKILDSYTLLYFPTKKFENE